MADSSIRTKRLLLRAARLDDQEAFHQFFRDPDCMRYECTPPRTKAQTRDFLECMVESDNNGILDFVICLLHSEPEAIDDEKALVIGKAGLYNGEEIGIILNKAHWGKGYASEALAPIIKRYWSMHAQDDDIVRVVKADVDPRNEASLSLLKKLGFEVVGSAKKTFKTHIGWCDSVYLEAKRPVT